MKLRQIICTKRVAIVLGFGHKWFSASSCTVGPEIGLYIYKRSFSSDKLDWGHLMSSYQVGPTMFPSNPIAGWSGLSLLRRLRAHAACEPVLCRSRYGSNYWLMFVELLFVFFCMCFCFPLVCFFSFVLYFPLVNLITKRIHVHPKYEFLLRVSVSHLK